MENLGHTFNFVCIDGVPCRRCHPGHHTHAIHWKKAAQSPEFFRDATVSDVEGHRVDVKFLDGDSATFFNHEDLGVLLSRGDAVRVHSRYKLLTVGARWLNVCTDAFTQARQ